MRYLRNTILAAALVVAGGALGQTTATPGQPDSATPITATTLEELVTTIQDQKGREKLVTQLQALLQAMKPEAAQERAGAALLNELVAFFSRFTDRLGKTSTQLVEQLQGLPERTRGFWLRLQEPGERSAILSDLLKLVLIVVAAFAAAVVTWYTLRRPYERLAGDDDPEIGPIERFGRLLGRLAIGMAPALAMLGIAFAGLALLPTTRSGGALALAVVSAVAVRRVLMAAFDFFLSADAPRIRVLPLADDLSVQVKRSLGRLAAAGVFGWFLLEAFVAAGAEAELVDPLRDLYGLVLLIGGVAVVLEYRKRALRPSESAEPLPGPVPEEPAPEGGAKPPRWRAVVLSVASLWWVAAVLYMAGVYAIWISDVPDAFGFMTRATVWTLVVLLGAVVVQAVLKRVLAGLSRKLERSTERIPAVQRQVPRYVTIVRCVLDSGLWLFATGLVLESWGVAALAALEAPAVRAILTAAVHIVIVVLIALALIDLTTALAERYLEDRGRKEKTMAKARTLVPLAQKAIKFVVAVVAAIMVLDRLGVQIGPLLAGAGVLGLAIGFGAQTLVKDVITGVFMLMEDTVSVGDVVNLDGTGGVVEAISIRTIRLRDLHGHVHTIPYSSVGKTTNLTKKFSCYVIDAGVAYREDVDQVISVLKELGEELRADPELGKDIIEPIEVFGVDRFADSAVIVRARLKTKPLRQWAIGREFNRRMKKRFDELGIEIPFPHQTVYWGVEKDGTAPPLRVQQVAASGGGSEA